MLNPIGTCGNIAQAGAVLAVAIKAVSLKLKQIALSLISSFRDH